MPSHELVDEDMEFCNKKSDITCLSFFVILPCYIQSKYQGDLLFKFLAPPVGESIPESLRYSTVYSRWFIVSFLKARMYMDQMSFSVMTARKSRAGFSTEVNVAYYFKLEGN